MSVLDPQTDVQIEVIVLRNIGGRTAPALENILVLDSFVKVSDIVVVHHTGTASTVEVWLTAC